MPELKAAMLAERVRQTASVSTNWRCSSRQMDLNAPSLRHPEGGERRVFRPALCPSATVAEGQRVYFYGIRPLSGPPKKLRLGQFRAAGNHNADSFGVWRPYILAAAADSWVDASSV